MKKIVLVLPLLFVASVSRADQVYAVNGSLTIVGNNVCSGLCVETVNFSFQLDEYAIRNAAGTNTYYVSIVPGASSVVSSGPLGTFDAPFGPLGIFGLPGGPESNYIEFHSPSFSTTSPSSEIDIWVSQDAVQAPFLPEIGGVDLFACGTQDCVMDFCIPGHSFTSCSDARPLFRLYIPGAVNSVVTPISAPEPGTLPLLASAFLALFLQRIRSKCSRIGSRKLSSNT